MCAHAPAASTTWTAATSGPLDGTLHLLSTRVREEAASNVVEGCTFAGGRSKTRHTRGCIKAMLTMRPHHCGHAAMQEPGSPLSIVNINLPIRIVHTYPYPYTYRHCPYAWTRCTPQNGLSTHRKKHWQECLPARLPAEGTGLLLKRPRMAELQSPTRMYMGKNRWRPLRISRLKLLRPSHKAY